MNTHLKLNASLKRIQTGLRSRADFFIKEIDGSKKRVSRFFTGEANERGIWLICEGTTEARFILFCDIEIINPIQL